MTLFSLPNLMREADHEAKRRLEALPRAVANGNMTVAVATTKIEQMQAIGDLIMFVIEQPLEFRRAAAARVEERQAVREQARLTGRRA